MSTRYSHYYNPKSIGVQFCNLCIHKNKLGIIKLQKRLLTFEPNDGSTKVEINIDQIQNISVIYNEKNQGELIKIEIPDNNLVFRFSDLSENEISNLSRIQAMLHTSSVVLDKKAARNKLYELLETRNMMDDEITLKQNFVKKVNFVDQLKIIHILDNEDINSLYKELCLSSVLKADEFMKFLRKKYNTIFCQTFELHQMNSLCRKCLNNHN